MIRAQEIDSIFENYNKRMDVIFEKYKAKMHAEINFSALKFRKKWNMAPAIVHWMPNRTFEDWLIRKLVGV